MKVRITPIVIIGWFYIMQYLTVYAADSGNNPIMNADPKYEDAVFSHQESEFDSSAGQECPHPPCKQLLRSSVRRLVRNWQKNQPLLPQPWPVSAVPPLPIKPPEVESIPDDQTDPKDGELELIR